MAENAAHIATTLHPKPSIFEVIAQDALAETLHPGLKRIVMFLGTISPTRFGWLVKWYDEAFLALNCVLQQYYLRNYGASFSEAFYGLQRVPIVSAIKRNDEILPLKNERLSLMFLTAFAYCKGKLDSQMEKWRLEEADGIQPREVWLQRYRSVVLRCYGILHFLWESLRLIYYIQYMSGISACHSPLLKMAGVTLEYISDDFDLLHMWKQTLRGNMSIPMFILQSSGSFFLYFLEIGAFFMQFVSWWNTNKSSKRLDSLPVPPAPEITLKDPKLNYLCPICLKERRNETVLPVSGYVFCYRCIVQHLNKEGKCPMTNYPASIAELIRLYPSVA